MANIINNIKLKNAPRFIGRKMTLDIEVGGHTGTHTYAIATKDGNRIISHNTVSLLPGEPPGCHFPNSRCYIRRVRLMNTSPLLPSLRKVGYHIEPCFGSEKTTVVVEFPIDIGEGTRTCEEVSIWEKAALVSMLQKHWSDNQVSVTIDFDVEKEADDIKHLLNYYQYDMKSVSFLPRFKTGHAYKQLPYETISEEKYKELISKLNLASISTSITGDKEKETEQDFGCDGDHCVKN